MTIYRVIGLGPTVSNHHSERAAIAAARRLEDGRVVMVERSGTYKSSTPVWPTRGTTQSN